MYTSYDPESEPVCEDAAAEPLREEPDLMAITGFVFATSATTSMNALPSLICSMYMMMALVLGSFST